MRALAIALVAFFLLEPMVRMLVREVRKPVVVLAHDGSASLLACWGYSCTSEPLTALSWKNWWNAWASATRFAPSPTASLWRRDRLRPARRLHRCGRPVPRRVRSLQWPDLGAVIIDGDGIVTRGRDPRLSATRLGVPVHAVMLGDTTVRPDLALKAVEHNRISYLGNEFPLLARVDARHLVGARTQVTVSQGERELATREVVVTGDPQLIEVPFTVKAERPGLQRYTVAHACRGRRGERDEQRAGHLHRCAGRPPEGAFARPGTAPRSGCTAQFALSGWKATVPIWPTRLSSRGRWPTMTWWCCTSCRPQSVAAAPAPARGGERNIPATLHPSDKATDMTAFNAAGAGVNASNMRRSITDAQAALNKDFTLFTLEPEDRPGPLNASRRCRCPSGSTIWGVPLRWT